MRKPFLLLVLASVLLLSCQKQQPAPEPIDSEWWHFTLRNEPFPDTYFDFPIRQL